VSELKREVDDILRGVRGRDRGDIDRVDIYRNLVGQEPVKIGSLSPSGSFLDTGTDERVCGWETYNDVDGENYRCGLPAHGAKVKHGNWVRV